MAKTEVLDKPTLSQLQDTLWDEIQRIRDGQTTAASVNAVTNATGKILSSVKLQMEYFRLTGKPLPEMPLLIEEK
jgi:hypothetical protein